MHAAANNTAPPFLFLGSAPGRYAILPHMGAERRQSQRIEILDELHGHAITLDEPVEIRDLGTGGFTMVTRSPFPIDSVHDFRLVCGPESVVMRGRLVHRRVVLEGDTTVYVSGIQFIDLSPEATAWLQAFMETLTVGVR